MQSWSERSKEVEELLRVPDLLGCLLSLHKMRAVLESFQNLPDHEANLAIISKFEKEMTQTARRQLLSGLDDGEKSREDSCCWDWMMVGDKEEY
jgi:hypothetical protein